MLAMVHSQFNPQKPLMNNISSWNIRGLNWPNKQEEVKIFFHNNKVGLIGLFEIKVKEKNVEKIAGSIFIGWRWAHNFELNRKGQIWVAWHLRPYAVDVVHKSE